MIFKNLCDHWQIPQGHLQLRQPTKLQEYCSIYILYPFLLCLTENIFFSTNIFQMLIQIHKVDIPSKPIHLQIVISLLEFKSYLATGYSERKLPKLELLGIFAKHQRERGKKVLLVGKKWIPPSRLSLPPKSPSSGAWTMSHHDACGAEWSKPAKEMGHWTGWNGDLLKDKILALLLERGTTWILIRMGRETSKLGSCDSSKLSELHCKSAP